MIYNQKEYEKIKERVKKDPSFCLVLLDIEHKRDAFVKGYDKWVK